MIGWFGMMRALMAQRDMAPWQHEPGPRRPRTMAELMGYASHAILEPSVGGVAASVLMGHWQDDTVIAPMPPLPMRPMPLPIDAETLADMPGMADDGTAGPHAVRPLVNDGPWLGATSGVTHPLLSGGAAGPGNTAGPVGLSGDDLGMLDGLPAMIRDAGVAVFDPRPLAP